MNHEKNEITGRLTVKRGNAQEKGFSLRGGGGTLELTYTRGEGESESGAHPAETRQGNSKDVFKKGKKGEGRC